MHRVMGFGLHPRSDLGRNLSFDAKSSGCVAAKNMHRLIVFGSRPLILHITFG